MVRWWLVRWVFQVVRVVTYEYRLDNLLIMLIAVRAADVFNLVSVEVVALPQPEHKAADPADGEEEHYGPVSAHVFNRQVTDAHRH